MLSGNSTLVEPAESGRNMVVDGLGAAAPIVTNAATSLSEANDVATATAARALFESQLSEGQRLERAELLALTETEFRSRIITRLPGSLWGLFSPDLFQQQTVPHFPTIFQAG